MMRRDFFILFAMRHKVAFCRTDAYAHLTFLSAAEPLL